jgi:hypothetical protein
MDAALALKILTRADAKSLRERSERLAWLERKGQPADGRLLPGGFSAATAYWEAGACFVGGQFLATVLLTQVCLEHLLAGLLGMSPEHENSHKLSAQRLFAVALKERVLTPAEFELFNGLRRSRNPHAHPRAIDDPQALPRRILDTQTPPDEIYRKDAEAAISALKALLDRQPFALGPHVEFTDADD